MKLTKEERTQLTYQIGDIIEQKCRRCYYNRSDDASFSINICIECPTGQTLRQLGRYFDTEPRERGGNPGNIPDGLTPARVRELNDQGIPDKDISIMFHRSPSYVYKLKKRWRAQGLWQGPNKVKKEPSKRKRGRRNGEGS
ncbi:helix-turn-helix domain-containing protein [Bacillus albus]|uniref:helix-turn-helix domain-containing protein n=1 Tax=Bacillus albus TaxID=2026189 RepID=UPI0010226FFA|nr:helix-turn-helix domain-containing protein [Bacillus albus]